MINAGQGRLSLHPLRACGAGFSSRKIQPKQSVPLPIESSAPAVLARRGIKAGWPGRLSPHAIRACGAGFSSRKLQPAQSVPLPIGTAAHYRTYRLPIETSAPAVLAGRGINAGWPARQAEPACNSRLRRGVVLTPVTAQTKRTTPYRNRRRHMAAHKSGLVRPHAADAASALESGFNPPGGLNPYALPRRRLSLHPFPP